MNTVKQLVETIKEGIQEKKGQDIVIADLSEMDHLSGWITYTGRSHRRISGRYVPQEPWRKAGECGRSGQRPVGGYGLCGCSRSHLPARSTRLLRPGASLGRRQAYPYSESRLIPKNTELGSRLYRCFKNGIKKDDALKQRIKREKRAYIK